MKILVSSNCQTGGLAATLKRMTGASEVAMSSIAWEETKESILSRVQKHLSEVEVWIASAREVSKIREIARENSKREIQVLSIPEIFFDAFHPDIAYANNKKNGRLYVPHYLSAIMVWAFNNSLTAVQTSRLFNQETFRELGYFNRWQASVQRIKSEFEGSDLSEYFPEFFLSVKRQGCFMHSLNHPKVDTIVKIGELAARKLGLDIVSRVSSGELPDVLASIVWPVYPEIGHELGISDSSYNWKFIEHGINLQGPSKYIEYWFDKFKLENIDPGDLEWAYCGTHGIDEKLKHVANRIL